MIPNFLRPRYLLSTGIIKSGGSSLILIALLCLAPSVASVAALEGKLLKKHQSAMQGKRLSENEKLTRYVQKVARKVLANSDHAGREYHFFLTDDHIPGAYTVGSGLIYIDRGLLSLLNSEAQLAGVIAHEIGHNVGKHTAKQGRRFKAGNFIANLASLLIGNSAVGQAMAIQNAANIYTFGRQAELESDRYAAEYLYAAKYAPDQMLYSLSALADFSTWFTQVSNAPPRHYGQFSTHPRVDTRLHTIIESAGQVPPGEEFIGRDEYREAVDGMIYGPSYRPNAPKGYERYINETLGITFVHPKTWTRTLSGPHIVLKDADDAVQLKISIEKTVDRSKTTKELIEAKYPDDLSNLEKLNPQSNRDLGMIGTRPNKRVALATVARTTFHFEGIAKNNVITQFQDQVMVYIIRSFRRLEPNDKEQQTVTTIRYQRLQPGDTFASLAKALNDKDPTVETQLRLLNGYYPKGEAEPGTWIKVFKKEELSDQQRKDAQRAGDAPQAE